jgi:hypothetical protein
MRVRNVVTLIVAAALLASCGGDDGGASSAEERAQRELEQALQDAGLGSIDLDDLELDIPDTGGGSTDIAPPVFFLTEPAEPPAGWVYDPPYCSSDDELGPPQFGYYVPGEWTRRGSGYGGSGGFDGSGDHDYELPGGGQIEIDTATDSYFMGDVLTADGGEVWESWDYDITEFSESGERSERIVFEQLAPVDVGGQQVELWYLDATKFELESQSKYKARVVFADLPSVGFGQDSRVPGSVTVTVTWDPEQVTPDEGEIRTVLSTMRIEKCVVEGYLDYYSMIFGTDWSS